MIPNQHLGTGGLTLVLPKADSFRSNITSGGSNIAVRIPNHIVPLTIIRKLGSPVVGTSANISNKPSATIAQEVVVQLGNDVDLVVDGGRCPGGLESTVVDVTGETFVILRKGIVSESDIRKVCEKYAEKVAKK